MSSCSNWWIYCSNFFELKLYSFWNAKWRSIVWKLSWMSLCVNRTMDGRNLKSLKTSLWKIRKNPKIILKNNFKNWFYSFLLSYQRNYNNLKLRWYFQRLAYRSRNSEIKIINKFSRNKKTIQKFQISSWGKQI